MGKASYTRPGVEAAVRLSKITRIETWIAIEDQYEEMLMQKDKGGTKLINLDKACNELGERWRRDTCTTAPAAGIGTRCNNKTDESEANPSIDGDASEHVMSCTLQELETIIEWKFAKGKPRPLWKHIRSNSNQAVQDATSAAFSKIDNIGSDGTLSSSCTSEFEECVRNAVKEITVLKGIGPAAASAILSLYRPDLFIFMDDEVIECLHSGKRVYTLPVYLEINSKCQDLANRLGKGWTPRRVGLTLWTAARICASTDDALIDLTLEEGNESVDNNEGMKGKRNNTTVASLEISDGNSGEHDLPAWKRRKRRR